MMPKPPTPPLLVLDQVGFAHPGQPPVLNGVSLQLQAGRFTCLLGRSGCGKSTLLQLACGLLRPQTGQVLWKGQVLRQPQADIALVFQRPTLLDWLSVLDNVLLPISLHRRVGAADRDAARHWLDRMQLSDLAQRYPPQLSGGQQSRVALARASLQGPALMCMDEPFSALDALTRESLQDDLLRVCAEAQMAVLFVTHDLAEAARLGSEIHLLSAGALHACPAPATDPGLQANWREQAAFHTLCNQLRHELSQHP